MVEKFPSPSNAIGVVFTHADFAAVLFNVAAVRTFTRPAPSGTPMPANSIETVSPGNVNLARETVN